MSGVRVGSRVDQLLDLRRRVDVELELARREVAAPRLSVGVEPVAILVGTGVVATPGTPPRAAVCPGPGTVPAAPVPPVQERPASCLVRVPLSHVLPSVLRDWANANGMKQATRGPVEDRAMRAFVEAHT